MLSRRLRLARSCRTGRAEPEHNCFKMTGYSDRRLAMTLRQACTRSTIASLPRAAKRRRLLPLSTPHLLPSSARPAPSSLIPATRCYATEVAHGHFGMFEVDRSVERAMDEVDVAIVGGGPAGLSAAIRIKQLAAESGKEVRVIVLEKGGEVGAACPFT